MNHICQYIMSHEERSLDKHIWSLRRIVCVSRRTEHNFCFYTSPRSFHLLRIKLYSSVMYRVQSVCYILAAAIIGSMSIIQSMLLCYLLKKQVCCIPTLLRWPIEDKRKTTLRVQYLQFLNKYLEILTCFWDAYSKFWGFYQKFWDGGLSRTFFLSLEGEPSPSPPNGFSYFGA